MSLRLTALLRITSVTDLLGFHFVLVAIYLPTDRIQCDECGPPCTRCAARKLQCTYLLSRKHVATKEKASPRRHLHLPALGSFQLAATLLPESAVATRSEEVEASRFSRTEPQRLELDLLHHYCTSTHRSLGEAFQIPYHVWQTFVVHEAFQHDFLLNGIFATAALHLAHEKMATDSRHDIMAAEYLGDALATFRRLLLHISADNVQALFAFAILLCVNMLGQLQSAITGLNWGGLLERLDGIFECLDGVRRLLSTGEDDLRNSPLGCILAQLSQEPGICPDADIRDQLQRLKELSHVAALHLPTADAKKDFYDRLIVDLESCFVHEVLVLHWFAKAGKEFQTDLRNGDAITKLLLAYWGTTLHALNRHWYAKDLGRVVVDMATKNLSSTESQMGILSRWTRQKVGLD